MHRRQFCSGLGWAVLAGLSGCLQLSIPRGDENGPGTSGTPVGTAALPIRVWLEATSAPEPETINPIKYGTLTDDEQSLVRTVLDQGEYTAAPESYHPAVDAFRRRIEERTDGAKRWPSISVTRGPGIGSGLPMGITSSPIRITDGDPGGSEPVAASIDRSAARRAEPHAWIAVERFRILGAGGATRYGRTTRRRSRPGRTPRRRRRPAPAGPAWPAPRPRS